MFAPHVIQIHAPHVLLHRGARRQARTRNHEHTRARTHEGGKSRAHTRTHFPQTQPQANAVSIPEWGLGFELLHKIGSWGWRSARRALRKQGANASWLLTCCSRPMSSTSRFPTCCRTSRFPTCCRTALNARSHAHASMHTRALAHTKVGNHARAHTRTLRGRICNQKLWGSPWCLWAAFFGRASYK